jgi:tRNA (guanine-N7-)-methyltransferase
MVEHPPTRTFKPRRRSLSSARAEVYARLAPRFVLDERGPMLDLDDVFGRAASAVLDIGIGIGDTMIEMAIAQPEHDVIGCDVHTPGIATSLARIDEHGLDNVRLVHGDALEFVERLAPRSLTGVRVYFPDPWPKVRQRHRRLVQPDVVGRLVDLLRPDGFFHLATDIDEYATQIERVCGSHPSLDGGAIARPRERPVTRYERKGIEAGRTVTDFWYTRTRTAGSDR